AFRMRSCRTPGSESSVSVPLIDIEHDAVAAAEAQRHHILLVITTRGQCPHQGDVLPDWAPQMIDIAVHEERAVSILACNTEILADRDQRHALAIDGGDIGMAHRAH